MLNKNLSSHCNGEEFAWSDQMSPEQVEEVEQMEVELVAGGGGGLVLP